MLPQPARMTIVPASKPVHTTRFEERLNILILSRQDRKRLNSGTQILDQLYQTRFATSQCSGLRLKFGERSVGSMLFPLTRSAAGYQMIRTHFFARSQFESLVFVNNC